MKLEYEVLKQEYETPDVQVIQLESKEDILDDNTSGYIPDPGED